MSKVLGSGYFLVTRHVAVHQQTVGENSVMFDALIRFLPWYSFPFLSRLLFSFFLEEREPFSYLASSQLRDLHHDSYGNQGEAWCETRLESCRTKRVKGKHNNRLSRHFASSFRGEKVEEKEVVKARDNNLPSFLQSNERAFLSPSFLLSNKTRMKGNIKNTRAIQEEATLSALFFFFCNSKVFLLLVVKYDQYH